MLDHNIVIDEKRGIRITLGVLIHFAITATAVILAYATIRSDLSNVIFQSQRNENQIKATTETLDKTRMEVNTLGAKFDEFMRSYDRDMNRYVRSDQDKR